MLCRPDDDNIVHPKYLSVKQSSQPSKSTDFRVILTRTGPASPVGALSKGGGQVQPVLGGVVNLMTSSLADYESGLAESLNSLLQVSHIGFLFTLHHLEEQREDESEESIWLRVEG